MISVIACTKRIDFLDNIISNFLRQRVPQKELILILNVSSVDVNKVEHRLEKYNIKKQVFHLDKDISLGECLNFGVIAAKFSIVCKFDDDDYYGPNYLNEAYKMIRTFEADLVGKASFFVFFKKYQQLFLYNPNHEKKWIKNNNNEEYKSTNFMSGATLVFRKEIFDQVSFPHVNVGEDSLFQKACFDRGIKMYSSSKYEYCHMRYEESHMHSSDAKDHQLKRMSSFIKPVKEADVIKLIKNK